MIENGGKLSSFKREVKGREKQLKSELKVVHMILRQVIKNIATNGQIAGNWVDVRNYFILMIKDLLDSYNSQYPDSKTFEEEKEVFLRHGRTICIQIFFIIQGRRRQARLTYIGMTLRHRREALRVRPNMSIDAKTQKTQQSDHPVTTNSALKFVFYTTASFFLFYS